MPLPGSVGGSEVPLTRKLAGFLLGCVGSVLMLELILWCLHAFFTPEGRAPGLLAPGPGERRIVCMGDSNTYGTNLRAHESYPGRLQSYLDLAPDNRWRVSNLGYPGQNTAQMRARLAENLAAYEPEILVLWGGVNDKWSPAMGHLWEYPDREPPTEEQSLLSRSRAYKALRMMLLEGQLELGGRERRYRKPMERGGDFEVPGLGDAQRGEGLGDVESVDSETQRVRFEADEVRGHILTDLRRILAICREHEVSLVLGQYWPQYAWIDEQVNAPIAEFAAQHDIPVPPLRDRMRGLAATHGRERIMLSDDHASAAGNREVARQVLFTLMDSGLLERRPEWEGVPPLESLFDQPRLELVGRGEDGLELDVLGPPGHRYRLRVEALFRAGPDGPIQALDLNRPRRKRFTPPFETRVGNVGSYGSRSVIQKLPEAGIDLSALLDRPGERCVGWRLQVEFRASDAQAGPGQPVLRSNSIEIGF